MATSCYRKSFLPLESNPDVFTVLAHRLGADPKLRFQDVWSLEESQLSSPALALILLFPTSEDYEDQREIRNVSREESSTCSVADGISWFPQTINNACGLYAVVHALCNGAAMRKLGPLNAQRSRNIVLIFHSPRFYLGQYIEGMCRTYWGGICPRS
jgi:ubiquitin carboxyl-terminal hydrolase L3